VVTFAEARLTDEVLGVREDYLGAALRSIEENYGGLAGYLDAASVAVQDVSRVRAALLG
jgi:protein-tyrosine phosphatase